MQLKYRVSAGLLVIAAALSILVPAGALFTGADGFLVRYVGLPQTRRMFLEIAVLFVAAFLLFVRIPARRGRLLAGVSLAAAFCWIHVVFLPMAVSALYLGAILLLGRFLGGRVFGLERKAGCSADFLLGSSFTVTVFCLLSAAGLGKPSILRVLWIAGGAVLYAAYLKTLLRRGGGFFSDITCGKTEKRTDGEADRETDRRIDRNTTVKTALCASFLLVMFLIQAGRMNIALDFDTLWYGVRSQYILAGGGGIYDNPGLVGMVYVYSKGLEVLTLPLCDLASYSYLLFFNLWMGALGLVVLRRIAGLFMERPFGVLACVLAAGVPGIMNMGISAKPDMITWLLQLIMVEFFFRYVKSLPPTASGMTSPSSDAESRRGRSPVWLLILTVGAYLFSLTMKPTSLVFSTAVFGMMGIYLLVFRRLRLAAPLRQWAALLFPAAALGAIWGRTMEITGMPVTSVFTSIFAKLGFQMKYPFATGSLPQNWQEESNLHVLVRRLYQMFLSPRGEDMGHVIIAWGTSLFFFLLICAAVLAAGGWLGKREKSPELTAAHMIFWPFLAVNLVSLVMLYQVDGNYFMLLYTFLILASCRLLARVRRDGEKLRLVILSLLLPILAFNLFVTAQTNWAWSAGFSEIRLVNKGRVNHKAEQHERLAASGNAAIWQILAADPDNRVVAFGNHPFCLQFPCNVQSYKDITAPWGNVELVNSPEAFEEYLEYAKTDYIYAEAGAIGLGSWDWSYGLLRDLIARGTLTDFFFENGNALARVSQEPVQEEEAEQNLRLFDEQYETFHEKGTKGDTK